MGAGDSSGRFWRHPGGKLIEQGPGSLNDAELLAILIGSGNRERSAEQIADEIIYRFGSLHGLLNQPLEKLVQIKGLGDVRVIRIAAAFEIARRLNTQKK